MSVTLAPGPLVSGLTGGLLLLLSVLVLRVRPRRSVNLALALFTAGLGTQTVLYYLLFPDDAFASGARAVAGIAAIGAGIGLVWLAWVMPRPWAVLHRLAHVAMPSGLAIAVAAFTLLAYVNDRGASEDLQRYPLAFRGGQTIFSPAFGLFVATVAFAPGRPAEERR